MWKSILEVSVEVVVCKVHTYPPGTRSIFKLLHVQTLAPRGMAASGKRSSLPHGTHGTGRHAIALLTLLVLPLPLTFTTIGSIPSTLWDSGALQDTIATAAPVALAILEF